MALYTSILLFASMMFYAIWFFTCKYWWKYGIIILLVNESYKFFNYVFQSFQFTIDNTDYLKYIGIAFFVVIVFCVTKTISYPLFYRQKHDNIGAESIINYKFRSLGRYQLFLDQFYDKDILSNQANVKEVLAEAFAITEKKGKSFGLPSMSDYFNEKRIWGYLILLIMVFIPFIDRTYYLAPDETVWDLEILKLETALFPSISLFLFFVLYLYGTVFLSLNIWFFTNQYWWKYFLLVPIIIKLYEIISVLNPNIRYFHENEIIQALPILLLLTGFLIWISLKIDNYHKVERIKEKIKVETFKIVALLAERENESKTVELKEEIEATISNRDNYQPEEYLSRLEILYEQLTKLQNKN
ncbi:hypothetical protein [Galbibacter sp. BG1]|uniref:hypothetical protein n=1 Tax=Galbibacter sp. BG1 TaxID=1170699 RepID=UPI001C705B05|nr:hypothetical protein [Galbibacter sp. BG1]